MDVVKYYRSKRTSGCIESFTNLRYRARGKPKGTLAKHRTH